MSDGSRMKATVVSLTKKKGISWGMADLRTVCRISLVVFVCRPMHVSSHHLLGPDLGLLVLAGGESRACHGRGAGSSGRAESGPREGAEEAGVHDGLSGVAGQRAAAEVQWAA
jgi:hypothetical protein